MSIRSNVISAIAVAVALTLGIVAGRALPPLPLVQNAFCPKPAEVVKETKQDKVPLPQTRPEESKKPDKPKAYKVPRTGD